MIKRTIPLIVLSIAAVLVLTYIPAAHAAGGTSGYVTPGDTGYNMDILALIGAGMYGAGIILVGYGKFYKKLVSGQL